MAMITNNGERVIPEEFKSKEEYLLYLRHLFAYEFAKDKVSENSSVLEVGCGEGYGTKLLSQSVEKIIGLDVDKNTIAHSSAKYGAENCLFKTYDGVKIPYDDSTFDTVVSFQVMEHIQDDINYVSEIYRVLKRNGVFILTTPNRTNRLKPGQKPWNRFHIREYYPEELQKILNNKFYDVEIWGIRGNDKVQRIEMERLKRHISLISIDPLNLRKLIPKRLKNILRRINHKENSTKNDEDFLNKYDLKNFYVIKSDVRESLDLLGICKK